MTCVSWYFERGLRHHRALKDSFALLLSCFEPSYHAAKILQFFHVIVRIFLSLDASESSESTIKSQKISPASRTSSTKSILSKEKSSESESSVTEDIKTGSIATENTAFQGSMAVGDAQKSSKASIQEDYVDDTFDSSSAAITASKSISYHPDNVLTSSARTLSKKRYTKDSDESKSEDDLSFAGKLFFIYRRFICLSM